MLSVQIAVLAALGALGYIVFQASRAVRASIDRLEGTLTDSVTRPEPLPDHAGLAEIRAEVAAIAARHREDVDRLTLAVSDGIAHVQRAEKRVQKTVTGARRLLKENGLEHAGIEAEAAELRERDEEGSDEPRVQLVQPSVEPSRRTTGIPGFRRQAAVG